MLLQEVVLCSLLPSSGAGAGLISVHDLQTGNALATFKQNASAAHCTAHVESKNGLGGIILAAQSSKALLNVYSFQKDQLMSKIILPEKLSCIALDSRGAYCAAGTTNGRLYLWEIASGILFSAFEAHYRIISALQFTQDGAAIISVSDDSTVSVWSMSRLLDEDSQNEIPSPYCSFTEHTLPVTDIVCGAGKFPSCRVFTSSADSTVKIWDLSTRIILTSIVFPKPISNLVVDPTERFVMAGSEDGSIYQCNLFRKRPDATNSRTMEALGGGGMSDVIRLVDDEATNQRLISVGQNISSLTLSLNASLLLVGTSSGQIQIYDVASHQLLRSINTYKDKGLEVTYVDTLLKPPDLFGHINLADGGASIRDTDPVRPVAAFQKTKDPVARAAHEISLMLPIQTSNPARFLPTTEELLREHRYFVQGPEGSPVTGISLQSRVSELETEVSKLRQQLGAAKGLNDAMWEGVVQKVIGSDDNTQANVDMEVDGTGRNRKKSRTTK
ncbi:hypothetical protein M422DRAFT_200031 [Sphaerobolus stellatus SS14]|nr:hypothetical protein M422DRAFT_200031 [Sphaerobolus stellatus SS14]